MKKLPLIIDCDPGIDDALALLLLYKHRDMFDVRLIAATAGNCPLTTTMNNVIYFRDKFFPEAKVSKGLERPLVKINPSNAEDVHGASGLGKIEVPHQDLSQVEDSLTAMRDALLSSKEKVTIMSIGALTNVARVLVAYPEVRSKVEKIYAMIGSVVGDGNIEPYAEFNAYFDPEALDIVAKAGIPIVFNPLEVGKGAKVSRSVFPTLNPTNELQQLAYDLITNIHEFRDKFNVGIYDAHTAVTLINPDLYTFVPCDVDVFTNYEVRGKSIMTENKSGMHKYQVVKDVAQCNQYILDELFSL